MVIVLAWFGVIALMMALIPVVAISPILLYIGMLIGAQAFQETPKRHAPAIVLALVPQIAAWGKTADRQRARRRRHHRGRAWASTSSARPACSIRAWRSWAAAPSWPASCSAAITVFIIERLREGGGLRLRRRGVHLLPA